MVLQLNYRSYQFLVLIFSTFCLACSAFAQIASLPPSGSDTGMGGVNSISGTVLGPSGQPVARRIRIKLSSSMMGDRITMTDENGSFLLRGLPSGNYTVIIDKEKEFEPVTSPVSIIQLRGMPAQQYTMNIRLVFKADSGSKPAVIASEFANVPPKAIGFYEKGLELAKSGDNKGALDQLQLAVAEYPNFMLAHAEMGVLYLRLNELQKADESLLMALKIAPEAFNPLMNRGIVLVTMKRFDEAEPVLRSALKVKEDSPVGRYFLGQALANLGRFDEAKKELNSAVTLDGRQMKEAYRLLAIICNAQGDKKSAAAALETYLQLAPTAPDAEQLRKVIQQMKGTSESTPASSSATKPTQ